MSPADELGTALATKAVEVALDMLLKQVAEELRKKPFWWRPRVGRIVRTVGAKLDDLVLDLQPCFAVIGSHTSIYEAFHSSSETMDELWNRTHYLLHVVGVWFREWDDMRQAVGTRRTPEVLVVQFKSLNALLESLGLVAPDVSRRFEGFPADHYARMTFRPVADRYNHFLTEYEALLRRLPQEVGIDRPSLKGEHFFIRL